MVSPTYDDAVDEGEVGPSAPIDDRRTRLGAGLYSLGDGVIITDPHGKIVLLNPSAEALTGWTDNEARDQPIEAVFRIINEVSRLPVFQPVQGVIASGGAQELARLTLLVAKDGSEHAIDDNASPIRSEAGDLDGVVLVFRDISERRRIEKGHERDRLRGEIVISAVHEAIVVLGLDLRIRSANRAFHEAFLTSPTETIGRSLFDFGHAVENGGRLRDALRGVLDGDETEGQSPAERDFEVAGGRIMRLSARKLHHVAGEDEEGLIFLTMEDVTDRRRMELVVEASELRYRRLFEAARDGILILDARSGMITDVNPFLLELLGYSPAEMLGRRLWEIGLLGDEAASRATFRELQEKGYVRYDDLPLVTRDDRRVDVEVVSNVYRAGGVETIQCNIRDVTARKQAEDQVRRAKEKAEEAGRAKDRFLATLSHELRTPLTPVLATLFHVEAQPNLPATLREDLATIRRNVEIEAKLIDDLLDLTRIAQGKMELTSEVVDCHEMLRAALAVCQVQVDAKRLEINLALQADSHVIWGDPVRLRQVFWNLIQNAAKFTPAKGRIRLSTRNVGDDRLAIEVEDNGAGIEAEALGRIFDAFEQAEPDVTRRFGGLGLGLAIAKQLVNLHGGTLDAVSAGRGQGSIFRVELATASIGPPSDSAPIAEETTFDPVDPTPGASDEVSLNLLLVEDNPDTRRAVARLLRGSGFAVRTAAGVITALSAMAIERFDLLISDIGLPDGSGLEVMRHGRDHFGLRGIAFSGYASDQDERESIEAGFAHHLAKPAALNQLVDLIRQTTVA